MIDQKRVVVALGAGLVGVLVWLANAIMDDVHDKLRYLREAHVRHLEWHQQRSAEQPSVWRSR